MLGTTFSFIGTGTLWVQCVKYFMTGKVCVLLFTVGKPAVQVTII